MKRDSCIPEIMCSLCTQLPTSYQLPVTAEWPGYISETLRLPLPQNKGTKAHSEIFSIN